ncbi:MAG: sulfatase-like hydrolase/transferase [Halodesulfurarchaeum sp.]
MDYNVVLLCLDSVRKDRFDRAASRLVRRANITFDSCRALSSWSAPSHASMLTGSLPSEHGVHSHSQRYDSVRKAETFLSSLGGYTTLGVSANPFACSFFGFDRLFDHFQDVQPGLPFSEGMHANQEKWSSPETGHALYRALLGRALEHEYPARSVVNALSSLLEEHVPTIPLPGRRDDGGREVIRQSKRLISRTDEPFFLFTNFMEAHQPFYRRRYHNATFQPRVDADESGVETVSDVPISWEFGAAEKTRTNVTGGLTDPVEQARYRAIYSADIASLASLLEGFLNWLQSRTERPTAIVITADHGENLGYESENNLIDHMASLSEGLLHVPLVVILPDADESREVEVMTSHSELGRLMLGLARGSGVPDMAVERPRAEILGGGEAQNQLDDEHDRYEFMTRMQRCVYADDRKFVWDTAGNAWSSDFHTEPTSFERQLSETFEVKEFDERCFDRGIRDVKDEAATGELTQEVSARLRDLGYA